MAIKKINIKNRKNKKRKPNWLLRFTLVVIIVPVLILGWVLITSVENTGEPIPGERFAKQLDPKITKEDIQKVKEALNYAETEKLEVDLKSATLRITIDTLNETTQEQNLAIVRDAYAKIDTVLPIATYFTNHDDIKMYDLEINVYNFIPEDRNAGGNVYYILARSGASEGDPESFINLVSAPKNQEVTDSVLRGGAAQ